MKILLLIDSLGSGGAQRQMVGLAKLLWDRGYQVKVIYYHPIYFYRPYLDEHHISNEYVADSKNKIKRIFMIARAIRSFCPEVVISYLDAPNVIACLLKALGMKFKLIVSERNVTQRLTRTERMKFFLMRWADAIVTNSYSQERFIKNHYPHFRPKIHTITNFVNTDIFVPQKKSSYGKYRILVVGRVSRQKNTLTFLGAINRLKNEGACFFVDWYGRSDGGFLMECQAYIDTHQLHDVFSFHEPIEDIVHEYQKSDIFCLPSLYEGFPNVICEAMSCGLPILCSNVCDNPILVENRKNGFLFDPHDVEDIKCKMKMMLALPEEKLLSMSLISRKMAEEKLSSVSFVEKYSELIGN